MDPETPDKKVEGTEKLPLRDFVEKSIFPHLDEGAQITFQMLRESSIDGLGKDFFREDYENFLQYDPEADGAIDFYAKAVLPVSFFAAIEDQISFKNVKEDFLEKAKIFAETTYRNAFFRNSYDTWEAWKSCSEFKQYRNLFESLGLMPEGAKERISSMSAELDALWSQSEVEKEFRNAEADEHVEAGGGAGGMLDTIVREEGEPIPEEQYSRYYYIRPDLFPEKYEDYLQKLEDFKHPYVLKL